MQSGYEGVESEMPEGMNLISIGKAEGPDHTERGMKLFRYRGSMPQHASSRV
jgi:hypothetical protein